MARIVMFVLDDVRSDVRVQREAATLRAAGHAVTIIGRPSDPLAREPEVDVVAGTEVRRVPIPGRVRRLLVGRGGGAASTAAPAGRAWAAPPADPGPSATRASGLARPARSVTSHLLRPVASGLARLARSAGSGLSWLVRWRLGAEAWCGAAAAAAPAADIWWAHDMDALPAALAARRRRGGRVVYDCHEVFVESGSNARRPGWARRVMAARERRWVGEVDAAVAVNASIADLLSPSLRRPAVVVRNTPPAWTPPASPPDHLRSTLGLGVGVPIVLYHGGFLADRGIPELVAALRTPAVAGCHLVLMGNGPLEPQLRRLAADPELESRVHLLPPVPPAVLLDWVAGADVGAMTNQPRTLNERVSTPNKLFECLAAGVPVVSSDFPERRRIVMDDPEGPLGAVCDPTDPGAIAAAIAAILDRTAAERQALRGRVLRAAHARYAWEAESVALIALAASLAPGASADHGA
jgi:glycosyltransferase involved in cell wall biosynthesis